MLQNVSVLPAAHTHGACQLATDSIFFTGEAAPNPGSALASDPGMTSRESRRFAHNAPNLPSQGRPETCATSEMDHEARIRGIKCGSPHVCALHWCKSYSNLLGRVCRNNHGRPSTWIRPRGRRPEGVRQFSLVPRLLRMPCITLCGLWQHGLGRSALPPTREGDAGLP